MLKPGFVADNEAALGKLAARTRRCAAVVGFVDADRDLFNAAAVCADGEVLGTYRKRLLPNYAVFDEARYFTPGNETDPLELYVIGGVKVGISICEDIWSPDGPLADAGRRRRRAGHQHQRLAVPPRQGRLPRADAGHPRRRRALARWSTSTRSAARTSWSSTAARWCSTPRATCSPAARSSSRTLLIVDVPVAGRLPPAPARPAWPRSRRCRCRRSSCPTAPVEHDERDRQPDRRARCRPDRRAVPGARPRHARLLRARTASPTSSSACPAASTRRSSPSSPPTRSAPTTCTACRCRRGTRATTRKSDAAKLAANLGLDYRTIPIEPAFTRLPRHARRRASTAARPASPRRTSRAAAAASC